MKTKRNFVTLALAAAMLLLLSACGKEVVSLVPVYKGETVTTTDHIFTTADFDVYLTYSDGTEEVLHDGYEITQKGMKNGYYIMDITAAVNELDYHPRYDYISMLKDFKNEMEKHGLVT